MKITNNERLAGIINSASFKKLNKSSTTMTQKNAEFDQLTISQTPLTQKSDEQFMSLLKSQLSSEVKLGASQYKIDDLSKQIALNKYDTNIADIARKMLMDQEV